MDRDAILKGVEEALELPAPTVADARTSFEETAKRLNVALWPAPTDDPRPYWERCPQEPRPARGLRRRLRAWGRQMYEISLCFVGACVVVMLIGALNVLLIPLNDFTHPPHPPGWDCYEKMGGNNFSGYSYEVCDVAEGWHIEMRNGAQIAVHDSARRSVRQRDIDTADAWYRLTRSQQQAVRKGDATIYDFVKFQGD